MNKKNNILIIALATTLLTTFQSKALITKEEVFKEVMAENALRLSSAPGEEPTEKTPFIFSIQFPKTLNRKPSVRVYRLGNKVEAVETMEYSAWENNTSTTSNIIDFILIEEKSRREFEVFVTDNLIPNVSEKTITSLSIPEETPFLSAKLIISTKTETKDKKEVKLVRCDIDPKSTMKIKIEKTPTILPDDAIIVLMDANLVEDFQSGTETEECKAKSLTKLVVKNSIPNKKIHEALINALLTSIDIDAFHSRQEKTKKIENGTILTKSTK